MKQHPHLQTVEKEAFDVSEKEAVQLESTIARLVSQAEAPSPAENPVTQEISKERILTYESNREQSRVLFITNEVQIFDTGSSVRQRLVELADVFDEVHILVLNIGKKTTKARERLAPNVWLYATHSRGFLWQLYDGATRAADELLFNEGFRADIIVALDPYESGALAAHLAARYDRPWQVHITADLFGTETLGTHPWWRTRLLKYALRRAYSVRTVNQTLADQITKRYRKITDIKVLPKYFQVHNLLDRPELKDDTLFTQFAFTMVAVGELTADSAMYRVLDAAAPLLQTPSIGLVIIGDGPLKRHLRQRAELLGIARQVVFHSVVKDKLRYVASADAFISTETDAASDEQVLQAAALGVPMVIATTPLRADLFTDGVEAFLCPADEVMAYTHKLRTLLNKSSYRTLFARSAPQVIRERIEEDPLLYRYAYRRLIESVLIEYADEESTAPAPTETSAEATPEAESDLSFSPQTVEVDGVRMKVPQTPPTVDK